MCATNQKKHAAKSVSGFDCNTLSFTHMCRLEKQQISCSNARTIENWAIGSYPNRIAGIFIELLSAIKSFVSSIDEILGLARISFTKLQ